MSTEKFEESGAHHTGLFEKDDVTSSDRDVRLDNTHEKITEIQKDPNFNFEKDVEEFEVLAMQEKARKPFITRILSFEKEVNFDDKRYMVWLLGVFAAGAGLLSGLDQSIISAARIGMGPALKLTTNEESLVSSLMPLGAVCGAIMITPLNEYLGRRASISVSTIWYTIGAALCAGSVSHQMMYAGRFTLGIGIGIEGCVGIYIAECVPKQYRGNIVSMYQLNIAFGEVLGYAVGAIFYEVDHGWRYMVGSSLIFSTALFIGLFFLPETPRYLVHKGRVGEAWSVWRRLRDVSDPENVLEFLEMRQAAIQDEERKAQESKTQVALELFTIPRNRRALIYALMMVALGQLTGVNAVMYYMSTLMAKIGFSTKHSVFMSLVGGGSLLIGTIPAILYMDRFGRRVWGMNIVGFFIGLCLVGGGYRINTETNLAAAEGVYLTGIILYMGFFGCYSCLTWVIPSESFGLRTRSLGLTFCSALLYICNFTVTYNFSKMQRAFTYTGLTLGFYGGIAFIGIIYQVLFMPETKGKTLEEIDDIFSKSSFTIAKENLANLKRGSLTGQ